MIQVTASFKRGPFVRHKARLAFGQKLAKDFVGLFAHTTLHQKAGKVGAGNQFRVAHKFQGAFKSSLDADFGQAIRHFHGPLGAPTAGLAQPLHQFRVVRVKPQADDVDGLANEGDRNLGARQVLHALGFGRGGGAVLAAHFVVVGQRPQFHTVGFGALGQGFRGQGAIRYNGVAVEVGVLNSSHPAILGAADF